MTFPKHRLPSIEELALSLVKIESPTPNDNGCQNIVFDLVTKNGFSGKYLPCGRVSNIAFSHGQRQSLQPVLVIVMHTDCVPIGRLENWSKLPLGIIENGFLYGRGASDMKGAIAATLLALIEFVKMFPDHLGQIWVLVNSIEEKMVAPSNMAELSEEDRLQHFAQNKNGAAFLAQWLYAQGIQPTWVLSPEPVARSEVGDRVSYGANGRMEVFVRCHATGGHTANEHCTNAIDAMDSFAGRMQSVPWQTMKGFNGAVPIVRSTGTISGNGALNVMPSIADRSINCRIPPGVNYECILNRIRGCLTGIDHTLSYDLTAEPYVSDMIDGFDHISGAVKEVMGFQPEYYVAHGGNDGNDIVSIAAKERALASLEGLVLPPIPAVAELGTTCTWSHKVDERVRLDDLSKLSLIIGAWMRRLLTN